MFRSEDGFTIQEILVAIIVGSILVSMCLSVFLFSSKLLFRWQRNVEVREAADRILQTIAMDVQTARSVMIAGDSSMVLERDGGRNITYRFDGGVWRNDVRLVSNGKIASLVSISRPSRDNDMVTIDVVCNLASSKHRASTEAGPIRSSRSAFLHAQSKSSMPSVNQ